MRITRENTNKFEKYGVDMSLYINNEDVPAASVLHLDVKGGHYEEFYHDKSTFIYYVIEGSGSFFLNGEENKVSATDLIVAKPGTKIYYLGKMKLLLTCAPRWEEQYEHHVRDIPRE